MKHYATILSQKDLKNQAETLLATWNFPILTNGMHIQSTMDIDDCSGFQKTEAMRGHYSAVTDRLDCMGGLICKNVIAPSFWQVSLNREAGHQEAYSRF